MIDDKLVNLRDLKAAYDSIRDISNDMIAPTESTNTASMAHDAGDYFILGDTLYVATADIASGDTIVASGTGSNCRAAVLGDEMSAIKTDVEVLKESSGAFPVVYYGADKSDTTYYGITYSRTGTDVALDGAPTGTAVVRIRLSGNAANAIATASVDGWAKTVPLLSGHKYRMVSEILSGSYSGNVSMRLTDEDNHNLISRSIGSSAAEIEGTGGSAMVYIYISNATSFNNLTVRITLTDITNEYALKTYVDGLKAETNAAIAETNTAVQALQDEIDPQPHEVQATLTTGKFYSYSSIVVGSAMPRPQSSSNGRYTAAPVDISFCAGGGILEMQLDSIEESSTIGYGITDENSIVIMSGVTSNDFVLTDGVYKCTKQISASSAKYLYLSNYKGSTTLSITLTKADAGKQDHIRYVSTSGSDDNDGKTSATAMATVTKAIESGGQTILLAGGVYRQAINLSTALDRIRIAAASKTGLPVLYATNSLISETEEAVSGYTKVYSCPCTKTFDDKNIWIFQDGVPDAATEITDTDRHPLQRGKAYRCDDTKITVCTATVLADALTEIENATGYKWFMDTANNVLYFSRPQAVTAANPLCGSFGSSLFSGAKRGLIVEMAGIGVKYQKINLGGMIAPTLTDCFCGNVRSEAGIQWDGASGAKLYRCEAFSVFYTRNSGDGFNAHSENTGDSFAKQTGCFMFDCWAHDNCDDGYSDHERCETTIFGGLYENNGAGVTPAQGSHCTCYNVFSRYNGEADFFYTGNPAAAEGGVGGQIACYGCVAKGKAASSNRGYRLNGSAVRGMFVGCVAIDEGTGFYGESSATGTLINCTTINCTTAKTSHYMAYNGTPVS